MKKILSSIVSLVAVAALILSFVAYSKVPEKVAGPQGPRGEQGMKGPKGDTIVGPRGSAGADAPVKLGSITGPDSYFPYYNRNGVVVRPQSLAIRTGTTTPCSFLSPAATSTLVRTTFNVTTGTSTSATLTLATSTTAFATTTAIITPYSGLIAKYSFAYNGTTTSGTNGGTIGSQPGSIFAPNTWLVYSLSGETWVGGGFAIGGTCKVEWAEL